MAGIEVRITGDKGIQAKLRQYVTSVPKATGAGLYAVASEVMRNAKRRVPVDTGTLRASGYVALPQTTGKNTTVTLGFGGPAKAYAFIQHERLDFHHTEGEAKYLENALRDVVDGGKGAAIFREAAQRVLLTGQAPPPSGPTSPNEGGVKHGGKKGARASKGRINARRGRSRQ